jgi:hypothetical protein
MIRIPVSRNFDFDFRLLLKPFPSNFYVEADGRSKDQGKIFARKQFSFCKEVEV